MFTTCKPLILASASPRRQQFLADLSLTFTILVADIDETPLAGEKPAAFACRMAQEKAEAIAQQYPASWVIGADTVVTLEGRILGKGAIKSAVFSIIRCIIAYLSVRVVSLKEKPKVIIRVCRPFI